MLKKRDLSCIRVGIQQIRAPHVVPPLTMAVKQEFPKLDVVFNENHGENLFNMLERGEIDLLLHNHMRQIPGISAEFLMKDRLLFITPKNHLLTHMELNLPSHILGSIYLGLKMKILCCCRKHIH